MIEIKVRDIDIGPLGENAVRAARARNEEQLMSITRKIDSKDLLNIYEAAAALGRDRMFWARHDRKSSFTGIGCARTIEAGGRRFTELKRAWKQLTEEAWIDNPYEGVSGTGLVALGGMSFDPDKPRTEAWRHFPDSRFVVPAYLLSRHGNQTYLTMNIAVQEHTSLADIKTAWRRFFKFMQDASAAGQAKPEIAGKEVICPEEWKETVRQAREAIRRKEAEKIVMARELRIQLKGKLESGYVIEKLLQAQQNSYVFAFEYGGDCFVGASPERLVKVERTEVLSTCLAGTAPRGMTPEADKQLADELLNDPKNRQEHQYVVHMIEEALEKHCTNLRIPQQPVVSRLKNLQHLYTPVTAQLKGGASILDLVQDLHPTPALGGTPRQAAMAFIREHELLERGWYGAPVGWMDAAGNGEFAVAIRSGLLHGKELSLFAGCGVVADSDPDKEYEETKIKFLPMLSVLEESR